MEVQRSQEIWLRVVKDLKRCEDGPLETSQFKTQYTLPDTEAAVQDKMPSIYKPINLGPNSFKWGHLLEEGFKGGNNHNKTQIDNRRMVTEAVNLMEPGKSASENLTRILDVTTESQSIDSPNKTVKMLRRPPTASSRETLTTTSSRNLSRRDGQSALMTPYQTYKLIPSASTVSIKLEFTSPIKPSKLASCNETLLNSESTSTSTKVEGISSPTLKVVPLRSKGFYYLQLLIIIFP